jgi:hypothetical protein
MGRVAERGGAGPGPSMAGLFGKYCFGSTQGVCVAEAHPYFKKQMLV